MLASREGIIGKNLRRSLGVLMSVATALSVPPPLPAFAAQNRADSLEAYWKFDETSAGTFYNSSGDIGATGTGSGVGGTNNTPQPSTDVPTGISSFSNPRSISFDGTDDRLSVGAFTPNTRAISFWLKTREDSNAPILYAGNDAWDTGQWDWAIFQFPGSQLIFQSGANGVTDATFSLNTWYHYVFLRSDGGQMKVYRNGVHIGSTTAPAMTNGIIRMGKAGGEYFNGLLDDVRIYSRSLTLAEIGELAAGSHMTASWTGKAGTGFENQKNWDGAYVPDPYSKIVIRAATGALTLTGAIKYAGLTINTGAVMLLNGTGTTMLDSGTFTNYGTLGLKNTETLTGFTNNTSKGTIMITGTGTTTGFKTGTSYNNLTLNDGLVGYWKLDDIDDVRDSSGYSNSGALMSGATISMTVAPTNFHNERSISFDGANDYIWASTKDFNFGATPRSIAGWINPTASSATRVPFAYGNCNRAGGVVGGSFGFYLNSANIIHFWGCGDDYGTGIAVTNGTWTHLAATYDGTRVRVYVNGGIAGGTGKTLAIPARPVMEIGSAHLMDNGNYHFPGQVDDVRVYKRMLSASEVAALAAGNQPSLQKASVTLNGALDIAGNLTLNGGTLDVSTSQYGIVLGGSWLNNGGVFVPRSSTVTFTGATSGMEILSGGQRFAKLTFNGTGGTWNTRDRLTASGTAVLIAGTLDAYGSHAMSFGQFVQNGGTITPRSGTIKITSPLNLTNTFTSALNVLRIEDPTENGLVGYWKFDEGTNTGSIVDSSGYAQTGLRRGSGSVWTSSALPSLSFDNPSAMSFNGYGDWVTSTVSSSFPDGSSSFTQALWLRTTGSGSLKTLLTRRNQGSWNQSDWPTMFLNQGRVTLSVDDNSYMNTTQYVAVNDGEWHHIAGVKNGNVYSLYVDGTLRDSITDSHPMNGSSGLPLAIGRAPSWSGSFFSGDMDDVRVYNRVLSSDEILNLARGRYAAGNSSTATVTLGGNLNTAYLALDSGNLSASGYTLTVTNSLSMLRGRGNLTLGGAVTTLGGLIMSGAKLTSGAGTLDINGDLTFQTGSLIAPSGYLTLSGNWNKTGGYFATSSGTLQLDGTDQTLSGSTTFYNLTKSVTSAETLTFEAGKTFIVNGMLTLNGAASNLLSLRSSMTGVPWIIHPIGSTGVQYLDVQDSTNTGSTAIDCLDLDCVDSGNNTNWIFGVTPPSSSSSQSSGHGQGPGGTRGKGTVMLMALRANAELKQDYNRTIVRQPDEEIPVKKDDVAVEKPKVDINDYRGEFTIERQRNRVVLAAADADVRLVYKDVVADAWYAPYVSRVIQDDVARGYKDGNGKLTGEFGVGNNVTRSEILKMALEASGQNELKAAAPRNKSAQGSWAAAYVGIAESLALSTFAPNTDVNAVATRGEVIQLIMETMGITIGNTPASYSDVSKDHPYTHAIAAATFFGLIVGDTKPDGTPLNTFRPDQPINRAEASKLIAMALALKKMGAIAPPAFGGAKQLSSVISSASFASAASAASSAAVELQQAKVIVQQLKVRIDSRPTADWVGTIYSGHIVTVLWPLDNGWLYIKTAYGKEGYIPADAVEMLKF